MGSIPTPGTIRGGWELVVGSCAAVGGRGAPDWDGRAVIALKRGGTFVLGPNSSARIHVNCVYDFNRIEMLTRSAVLVTA